MAEFKIRVLIRDIDDEREWLDELENTEEIVGIMRADTEDKKEVCRTIMKMLNTMVNE